MRHICLLSTWCVTDTDSNKHPAHMRGEEMESRRSMHQERVSAGRPHNTEQLGDLFLFPQGHLSRAQEADWHSSTTSMDLASSRHRA